MPGTEGTTRPATAVEGTELVFRLADPERAHDAVSVWADVDLGVEPAVDSVVDVALERVPGGWERRIPAPGLDCLEYLLDVDGELVPDPGNPETVDGAFGPHSWLAMPGYRPPAWLDADSDAGTRETLTAGEVDVEVWSPTGGSGDELPLLLVHDGGEMDRFARVTQYAGTWVRPVRVALLSPGESRDERYAANPAYADALVGEVVPALVAAHPTRGLPVLAGASLGGLAALHAAWLHPDAFGGLLLQSGSFFTPVLDPQESAWSHFAEVTAFVATVLAARRARLPAYVAMTCGTAEENLANNRAMAEHLGRLGADVTWAEARQGHTWTCWRDTLDPSLADLVTKGWG